MSGFEPTTVKGKWLEFNDLNHSPTDAPSILIIVENVEMLFLYADFPIIQKRVHIYQIDLKLERM
jgi:hypothetical protein